MTIRTTILRCLRTSSREHKAQNMNSKILNRKLNSVGKQVFVEQFHVFKKHADGQISRGHAISTLVKLGVSNDSGAARRVEMQSKYLLLKW